MLRFFTEKSAGFWTNLLKYTFAMAEKHAKLRVMGTWTGQELGHPVQPRRQGYEFSRERLHVKKRDEVEEYSNIRGAHN